MASETQAVLFLLVYLFVAHLHRLVLPYVLINGGMGVTRADILVVVEFMIKFGLLSFLL